MSDSVKKFLQKNTILITQPNLINFDHLTNINLYLN